MSEQTDRVRQRRWTPTSTGPEWQYAESILGLPSLACVCGQTFGKIALFCPLHTPSGTAAGPGPTDQVDRP